MHDAESEIRRLLNETDRPLKHIAAEAGVGYDRLKSWFSGRTLTLSVGDAERLYLNLTGKSFTQ